MSSSEEIAAMFFISAVESVECAALAESIEKYFPKVQSFSFIIDQEKREQVEEKYQAIRGRINAMKSMADFCPKINVAAKLLGIEISDESSD